MNPQHNGPTNLNLPPPVTETPVESGNGNAAAPEQVVTPEVVTQAPQAAPAVDPLQLAAPAQAVSEPAQQQSDDVTTTKSSTPVLADDSDLIEKEWVNKAKAIIERTREDPYQQSKEITSVKADYLQKRFNKAVKVAK